MGFPTQENKSSPGFPTQKDSSSAGFTTQKYCIAHLRVSLYKKDSSFAVSLLRTILQCHYIEGYLKCAFTPQKDSSFVVSYTLLKNSKLINHKLS